MLFRSGIEIGQILFILMLVAAFIALRPGVLRFIKPGDSAALHWTRLALPVSYLVGGVACYWTIDRIAGFWV